jgi:hypothetical protein
MDNININPNPNNIQSTIGPQYWSKVDHPEDGTVEYCHTLAPFSIRAKYIAKDNYIEFFIKDGKLGNLGASYMHCEDFEAWEREFVYNGKYKTFFTQRKIQLYN